MNHVVLRRRDRYVCNSSEEYWKSFFIYLSIVFLRSPLLFLNVSLFSRLSFTYVKIYNKNYGTWPWLLIWNPGETFLKVGFFLWTLIILLYSFFFSFIQTISLFFPVTWETQKGFTLSFQIVQRFFEIVNELM